MTLLDWQVRAVDEHDELKIKIAKLSEFVLHDSRFAALDAEDRELLMDQRHVMLEYSWILSARILRFERHV